MFLNLLKKKVEFLLENEDGCIDLVNQYDMSVYLDIVYENEGQYVILKPKESTVDDVLSLKAIHTADGIEVQIVKILGKDKIFYKKLCTVQECTELFHTFFNEHTIAIGERG